MTDHREKTWEQLAEDEAGTVYVDDWSDGVRFIVLRSHASLCAYVGIPNDHPLAGFDYDNLPTCDEVHGGWTYSAEGTGWLPKNWWWYGWDYAHSGDRCFYDLKYGDKKRDYEHEWIVEEVEQHARWVCYDFRRLCNLAESLMRKRAPIAA